MIKFKKKNIDVICLILPLFCVFLITNTAYSSNFLLRPPLASHGHESESSIEEKVITDFIESKGEKGANKNDIADYLFHDNVTGKKMNIEEWYSLVQDVLTRLLSRNNITYRDIKGLARRYFTIEHAPDSITHHPSEVYVDAINGSQDILRNFFEKLNIEFTIINTELHSGTTNEAILQTLKKLTGQKDLSFENIPKSLLLRVQSKRKDATKYILLVLPLDEEYDEKMVKKVCNDNNVLTKTAKHVNLPDASKVKELTGYEIGSIAPLPIVLGDTPVSIHIIIDPSIYKDGDNKISLPLNTKGAKIVIAAKDLKFAIEQTGIHKVIIAPLIKQIYSDMNRGKIEENL